MKDVLSILYIYHAILDVGYCLPFSRKIMLKAFPEQYAGDYIKWQLIDALIWLFGLMQNLKSAFLF